MSVYFVKSKGWRYDFTLNGRRHTASWFATKREAVRAESAKKADLIKPQAEGIPRILGHENRLTTELYLHSIGHAERTAIAILEDSNSNSHTGLTRMPAGCGGVSL